MASQFAFKTPDFDKMPAGLIPAIVQDAGTRQVLMLGYMNREALQQTQDSGLVTFFSRSRQSIWTKGETSGNTLRVVDILLDCDQDSLLVLANPDGPVCHTGADTCWQQKNEAAGFLYTLENLIQERKRSPVEGSYTNKLLSSGIPKAAQKVGEEAVEVVIEALGNRKDLLLNESADLLYHLLVLFTACDVSLQEVEQVLRLRHAGTNINLNKP
ncbi:MAG TPA: bifunctional phosphoribosyl-AMP cyclohydrolase/phosphoribosyl-ATP diphosphatase HisIE [Saprospiraceae bacterium]|nr:bifunctional phosphoribosyl-AMP cyclohydrolase/phosphoribosyl-ATP diphosphatase HisIE [Saprospiraceae bacterium]